MNNHFEGVITALVTPFKDGEVDRSSLQRLVKAQLDGGVSGFVVNGTTAESPTLSSDEVKSIYEIVASEVNDQVPLILGTGSNCTRTTIEKTTLAKALGASAALVVTPYYNKPSQRGLFAHFSSVAETVEIPIILYDVPGRSIVRFDVDTLSQLSKKTNIVAVKDATGDLEFAGQYLSEENIIGLSGDDPTCIDYMLSGGKGVISVISHLIPKVMSELSSRAIGGDTKASSDYEDWMDLVKGIYIDSNPVPVKRALKEIGIIDTAEVRLPLVEMQKSDEDKLLSILKGKGL